MARPGGLRALIAGSFGFYNFGGDVMGLPLKVSLEDWHGGTENFNSNYVFLPEFAESRRGRLTGTPK